MTTRGLRLFVLTGLLSACVTPSAHADSSAKDLAGPATVENRVNEADLTRIALTPDAERRLGIELVVAERKSVVRTRRLPGEAVTPPGRSIVVSAPVAGLVTVPTSASVPPTAGQQVEHGEPLFRLLPGESPDGRTFVPADRISLARATADLSAARVEAEGRLEEARVRVDAGEIKLKRAEQLQQEGAGAQRALDEARAEFNLARTARTAAQERVETLSKVLASLESTEQAAVTIESPLHGYVRTLHVAPGQVVSSGAPLLEVVAPDPIWVRVPIYVGELSAIESNMPARVNGLTDGLEQPGREARWVPVPGSADPHAATVDLFFELANPRAELRPGQRVSVELLTAAAAEALVVPHAAILIDVYGGTWVYQNVGPQEYVRRRVAVRDVVGDLAVLGRGLDPGAKVVTAGAAELFGTEFGAGK